jgi:hypothetical protein
MWKPVVGHLFKSFLWGQMYLHAQWACLSFRGNNGHSKVHETSPWTLAMCSQLWHSTHLSKVFYKVRSICVHTRLDWAAAFQDNTNCSKAYAALPIPLLSHCQDPLISLFSQKIFLWVKHISMCRGSNDWNPLALLAGFHAGLSAAGSEAWTLTPVQWPR